MLVMKFGGSSLADRERVGNVCALIKRRKPRVVIVSAPGARFAKDTKVTDLLARAHHTFINGAWGEAADIISRVHERFASICSHADCAQFITETCERMKEPRYLADGPWLISRGEYLMAQIVAHNLGVPWVDAKEIITLAPDGHFSGDYAPIVRAITAVDPETVIIPGFYGRGFDGNIATFSRGGSDITGAIVARALKATRYENWTDVLGVYAADPRIVSEATPVEELSFRELRELAYLGAKVLHPDTLAPLMEADIELRIRSTFDPDSSGTRVVSMRTAQDGRPVAIAGKGGYLAVHIYKPGMNRIVGYIRGILSVLERHGVNFEHLPTGIDTASIVLSTDNMSETVREKILTSLASRADAREFRVHHSLAMIAVVGEGMARQKGVAAAVFGALADAGINVRIISQGAAEISIIIGVDENDLPSALRALHAALLS